MPSTTRLAVLIAVAVFVTFMIVKSRIPLFRDPAIAKARKAIAKAKQRARRAKDGPERADAYREASSIALEDLGRPGLAASFARRADKADPTSIASVKLLARAMRSAERYRALEKLLWQRLEAAEMATDRAQLLFEELLALYEGPLRSRAQAKVLRSLRAPGSGRDEEA